MTAPFVQIEEVVSFNVTCLKCRVRFKAATQERAEFLVRKHLQTAHPEEGQS